MPKPIEPIILKNKPLIEAIFEIRWELQKGPEEGMQIDPHYKLLIGRIYEKMRNKYPFHEQLPTVNMPDEIAGYIIQHRFRKKKDEWPLIQIGPGIITLNDTKNYIWSDFEKRAEYLIKVLFELYPDAEKNLRIRSLLLRYIDAIEFDYERQNIFNFLKEQMKMDINIHEQLFEETGVSKLPYGFDLRFNFPLDNPKGAIHLRFARGRRENSDGLIWETNILSSEKDAPDSKNEINQWIKKAHGLAHNWFLKSIEGELRKRFE